MMNFSKYKRIYVLSLLLIVICSITIVCSSFDERMILNGEAVIRVDADIRVVGIAMNKVEGHAYETYNCTFSKNSTNMYLTLPELTSKITYKVTVKNKTDKVYVINNITTNINNSNITYEISDYKIGQGLGPKVDTVFYITFKYNDSVKQLPANKAAIATFNYTFVIPYAEIVEYKNQEYTTCTNVQCALDELYTLLK